MDELVTAFLLLLCLGAVAALVWWLIAYSAKVSRRVNTAWASAAERLGGRFTPLHGPWYNKKARNVRASIDGVEVLADHYTVSTGKSSTTYTRIRATAAAPAGMELQIFRKHALSGLGQALGFQDVRTGHERFDEEFTVKSNTPDLVPVWLGQEVRRAVVRASDYAMRMSDGEVKAQRVGLEDDAGLLERAMTAVAQLAGRGVWMQNRWRAMADELGGSLRSRSSAWSLDGASSIVVAWQDVQITVDVVKDREGMMGGEWRLTTRVRGRRRGGKPIAPRRTLVGRVPARIEGNDTHVTLSIEGVVVGSTTLQTAIETVGRTAAEGEIGPYR